MISCQLTLTNPQTPTNSQNQLVLLTGFPGLQHHFTQCWLLSRQLAPLCSLAVHLFTFESTLRETLSPFHLFRFLNTKWGFVCRKEHDPTLPLL